MRISRVAESYWHLNDNIQDSQKSLFKTVLVNGMNHGAFLSGNKPQYLADHDLPAEGDGFVTKVADVINSFVSGANDFENDSTELALRPLVQAMELEGYY